MTMNFLASTLLTGYTKDFNNTNDAVLCDGRELQYIVGSNYLRNVREGRE